MPQPIDLILRGGRIVTPGGIADADLAIAEGKIAAIGRIGEVSAREDLPIAGLTVLRYVPLGRALAETIIGTAVGGALGVQFLGQGWLVGALGGFGLAVIRLRMPSSS